MYLLGASFHCGFCICVALLGHHTYIQYIILIGAIETKKMNYFWLASWHPENRYFENAEKLPH